MDTYSGDVIVNGAPDIRQLANLTIIKAALGPMHNNSYLLQCRHTGYSLLIDAAHAPERLLDLYAELPVVESTQQLQGVVTTHAHADHWQALAELVQVTGSPTFAGVNDAPQIPVPTDHVLRDGDVLDLGRITLRIRELRGHTPGGIALIYEDPATGTAHAFVGDSLFPGGLGNTKNPGQNFAQLYADVTERLFDAYPDSTWIYPGHGGDTTLGRERPHLTQWLERGW